METIGLYDNQRNGKMGRGRQHGVHAMTARYNRLYEEPAYGVSEAAVYLRVPYNT
jgi:hypothetical protein